MSVTKNEIIKHIWIQYWWIYIFLYNAKRMQATREIGLLDQLPL